MRRDPVPRPRESHRRYRPRALAAATTALVLGGLLGGCGGPSFRATSAEGSYPVVFGVFDPFTGLDATAGPEKMGGCLAAVRLVDAGGGILSHRQVSCRAFDDRDDTARAEAAAAVMVRARGLVGVLGPAGDAGAGAAAVIERARMTMFSDSPDPAFSHAALPYFWRIVPPPEDAGLAMALWARDQGYTRMAAVFGDDAAEQAAVPTLVRAFEHLGGTVTIAQAVPLDAASYRTEIARMLASSPQALFAGMDPASAATYVGQAAQAHPLLPIVGGPGTEDPAWWAAVGRAAGAPWLSRHYVGVEAYAPAAGPAWAAYSRSLQALGARVPDAALYAADPNAMAAYDAVNIMALAMTAAGSTDPAVYNAYVDKVVTGGAGAEVVHDFQEGKRALESGRVIQYVGAAGAVRFTRWQSSPGAFQVDSVDATDPTGERVVATFPASQVAALAGAPGI
ncbi:MAG: ABC transporter substrate-binding protein [Candidatus Dormibacterales bacterium]